MYSTDRHLRSIGKKDIYFLVLLERSLHLVAVYANNRELSFYSLTQIPEEKVYFRFWLHEATQNSTPTTHKKRRKKEKKNKHKQLKFVCRCRCHCKHLLLWQKAIG